MTVSKDKKVFLSAFGGDVMPIAGFYGPMDESAYEGKVYPSLKTDAMFKDIKEAGFNVIMQMNDTVDVNPESVTLTLELCKKHGLTYFIRHGSLFKVSGYNSESSGFPIASAKEFKAALEPYLKHGACAGLYICDEPVKGALPYLGSAIARYKETLKEAGLTDRTYYVNLLPWNVHSGRSVAEYDDYLDKAVTEGGLDYLSYDFYPFVYADNLKKHFPDARHAISPGVFNLAGQLRRAAKSHEVPFWAFVQMGGNWTEAEDNLYVRRPSAEEVIWEVNVFLAYGAKGINYFTLNNPVSFFKYLKNKGETGAFLPSGERSNLYEAAKAANAQIAAVDEVLMNAVSEQIITHGGLPTVMEFCDGVTSNPEYRELAGISGGDALIGCFDYLGKTAFYVVNNTVYEKTSVTLEFKHECSLRIIDRRRETAAGGETAVLDLDAGEAALIVIEKTLKG